MGQVYSSDPKSDEPTDHSLTTPDRNADFEIEHVAGILYKCKYDNTIQGRSAITQSDEHTQLILLRKRGVGWGISERGRKRFSLGIQTVLQAGAAASVIAGLLILAITHPIIFGVLIGLLVLVPTVVYATGKMRDLHQNS
jgi:hypothetical protein